MDSQKIQWYYHQEKKSSMFNTNTRHIAESFNSITFSREELRGAVREFEDEFGSSVEDEEEKELIAQAQHSIAVKVKLELLDQLQASLKTQTVSDLGHAIAKVESPLTHYLMEQYKVHDPEIANLAKDAKTIHTLECEVQRQLDNVLHLKDEDIKKMMDLQDPSPNVLATLKGTLILLGFTEEIAVSNAIAILKHFERLCCKFGRSKAFIPQCHHVLMCELCSMLALFSVYVIFERHPER